MKRVIYVPGGERYVSLGSYVKAIKKAKTHPSWEFKYGLTCWWPCTGAEVVAQFWQGVQDRINQGIPYCKRGSRGQREPDERRC